MGTIPNALAACFLYFAKASASLCRKIFHSLSLILIVFIFCQFSNQSVASEGVTDSLNQSQFEGVKSQHAFNKASIAVFQQSLERFEHASDCQASCPEGCCSSGNSLMVEAAMYQFIAKETEKRAQQSYQAALKSCEARNQVSSVESDCSKTLETVVPFPRDANTFDKSGSCLKSKSECGMYSSGLDLQIANMNKGKIGTFNDYLNNVKLQPDNSVTIKLSSGLKTISAADFSDPKMLEKFGFNPRTARRISAKYGRLNTIVQTSNPSGRSNVLATTPAEKTAETSLSEAQALMQNESTAKTEINLESEKKAPANAKDFFFMLGDEKIGSWRNNIFIMMNQRYHDLSLNQQFIEN